MDADEVTVQGKQLPVRRATKQSLGTETFIIGTASMWRLSGTMISRASHENPIFRLTARHR